MGNILIQEELLLPQLAFNPGLVLTTFRTTRPMCINADKWIPGKLLRQAHGILGGGGGGVACDR